MNSPAASGTLAIAIPSYGRDQVLIDTVDALLSLDSPADELLVIDQSLHHSRECEEQLQRWHTTGRIRWLRLPRPSITAAMNAALKQACSERVLFLDDDIIPDADLVRAHRAAAQAHPDAMVAGRVLQPWHHGALDADDAPFRFNSARGRDLDEFMGGNVSMDRRTAISIGGFDQNFVRVAYRFEAEFAHRWRRHGHRIHYEPKALIHHLKVCGGGTRSYGNHLTTLRPDHAVGRYYYLVRTLAPRQALQASLIALATSVRSRHHLRQPWWIPLTLMAELQGWLWALWLAWHGPAWLLDRPLRLLIATSHPIQYQVPLFRQLNSDSELQSEVLFLSLPDAQRQGSGFERPFVWDVPLLDGYRWRQASNTAGDGDLGRFLGLWLWNPGAELAMADAAAPDALLITGWHCLGLLQLILAARLKRLPILMRMEANDQRRRRRPLRLLHRLLLSCVTYGLPIGSANARFYISHGVPANRLVAAPYGVDNDHFASLASTFRRDRAAWRQRWGIPEERFCALFCGKLQAKKRPQDLLAALALLQQRHGRSVVHLLMVGSGELEAELREQASRENLPVSFVGFLNQRELPAAYGAADGLVLPSDSGETWGLVVNEAMACELPVIVSDQAGCSEDLVRNHETGLRFACADVSALADCLELLAGDPDRARAMGQRGASLIRQSYSLTAAEKGIHQAMALLSCQPQT